MEKDKKPKLNTSWGKVASWYDEYLGGDDTYQAQVILPNLMRLLDAKKGEKILDLACGQGFFAREIAKTGATVIGSDIAKELIEEAKKRGDDVSYHVAPATALTFAEDATFDAATCVLAIQNIEDILTTFKEVKRVLKPGGRFLMVVNHPTFRVLKRSSWGWDDVQKVQYRRVDGYLSGAKVEVDMHPGAGRSVKTTSFHRSMQDFFKALSGAGLVVSRLEEWISHKVSQAGSRQKAEDTARKEIPLFMVFEVRNF